MMDSGDIIDRVSKDEYVDFENTENQMFDDITNEHDENDENDEGDKNDEHYDVETPKEDSLEESEGSIEDINLKELSDEEFSKTKIIVDESYGSVNELKAICKNLGIQLRQVIKQHLLNVLWIINKIKYILIIYNKWMLWIM